MPGQPRDSYDTVVRKLADLDRRMEIQERHRHPTGRNEPTAGAGLNDYVYLWINTPDPTITGDGNNVIDWTGDVATIGTGDLTWPYAADNESVGPLWPNALYLATGSVQVTGQAVGDSARIELLTSPSSYLIGPHAGNGYTKMSSSLEPYISVSRLVMVTATAAIKLNVAVEVASGATVSTFQDLTFGVVRIA